MDLAERLPPDTLEVVAPVAGRARGDDVRRAEHLGSDADEGGLADSPLAVDERVLAGLLGDGEEISELPRPAREERLPVDGCRRAEDLGQCLEALDLLRLAALQPRAHGLDRTALADGVTTPRAGSAGRTPGRLPAASPVNAGIAKLELSTT